MKFFQSNLQIYLLLVCCLSYSYISINAMDDEKSSDPDVVITISSHSSGYGMKRSSSMSSLHRLRSFDDRSLQQPLNPLSPSINRTFKSTKAEKKQTKSKGCLSHICCYKVSVGVITLIACTAAGISIYAVNKLYDGCHALQEDAQRAVRGCSQAKVVGEQALAIGKEILKKCSHI